MSATINRYAATETWDFDLMRAANKDAGQFFWSSDTLRFFRGRDGEVHQGPGGVFFSHSIRGARDGDARWYKVSRFDPATSHVYSVDLPGGALFLTTFREAHRMARDLARG